MCKTIDLANTIVVKLGGSIFDSRDTTIQDIIRLQNQGAQLVLVHGGANLVTKWLGRMNAKTEFYQGERITDLTSLEVVTAVLGGLVNKEITAAINLGGGRAAGICGADGSLIQGRLRNEKMGFVGDVVGVDTEVLEALLQEDIMPVVAPVSLYSIDRPESAPLLLNVNGDTVASEIARECRAKKLILLTDVEGIRDGSGRAIDKLSPEQAEGLLASGVASGGMIPKIKSCLVAVSNGVTECIVIDGRRQHALIDAIAGNGGGTRISAAK